MITLLLIVAIFSFSVLMHFERDETLGGFPIPKGAELDRETPRSKHFHWDASTGTDLPIRYKLAIKRAGFEEVPIDGQMSQFIKEDVSIVVIPSTDYIEILLQ